MKMLDDIVEGAVDDKVSLASLLRKCLVVADKLKNDTLKQWVLAELNGYTDRALLPEYRIISINAVGQFVGSFGRSIANQPLPAFTMDEEHREWATTAYLMEPIASFEMLKNSTKQDNLAIPWPGDLVALYERAWFPDQGFALNRAHQVITRSSVIGLIETVRNKLLEFAIELRKDIGASEPTPENPPASTVEKHVTQIIYGGQINVHGSTVSGSINQSISQTVIKGDFESLSKALTSIGVPEGALPELKAALDEDAKAGQKTGMGPKAGGWVSKTIKAAGSVGFKVATTVAEHEITAAILHYLGQSM